MTQAARLSTSLQSPPPTGPLWPLRKQLPQPQWRHKAQ